MRTVITCMGECLIDFLPLSTSSGPKQGGPTIDFRMHAAGSIFNVAVGAARLGQHVAFAGTIAEDFFGHHLLKALQAENVDTRFVTTVNAQSTLAIVAVENGQATFSFYGENAADTLLTLENLPAAFYEETAMLHFGSISLLRGQTPATILAAAQRLKGTVLLSFDPNIRASLVHDEPAYRTTLQQAIALTDILKLSDVDLAWLLPGIAAEDAIQQLSEQGPALVIITQGDKGVLAKRGSSAVLHIPTFPVTVIDTVGAGDTFCAGTLVRLAEQGITSREAVLALSEAELRETLRFAAAVAAINCSRAGANAPTRTEVAHFLKEM